MRDKKYEYLRYKRKSLLIAGWTRFAVILNQPSGRTASNYEGVAGGGIHSRSLHPKYAHKYSMTFMSGDWVGQEICSNSTSCSWNYSWKCFVVWIVELSSWKINAIQAIRCELNDGNSHLEFHENDQIWCYHAE